MKNTSRNRGDFYVKNKDSYAEHFDYGINIINDDTIYVCICRNTTKAASSKMTVILDPEEKGNSSTTSINVSGLPENAVITKLTIV